MNNKLSELSKPVAWKIHNDDHYFLEMREEEAEAHGRMGKKGDAVYSQEYVSALIKQAEKAEEFREQMVKYVLTLGSSVISPSVVETILNAAERSKAHK